MYTCYSVQHKGNVSYGLCKLKDLCCYRGISKNTIFGEVNQLCFVICFPLYDLLLLYGALFICNRAKEKYR